MKTLGSDPIKSGRILYAMAGLQCYIMLSFHPTTHSGVRHSKVGIKKKKSRVKIS